MTAARDGGDAFPSPGVVLEYERNGTRQQHQQGAYGGMTLRDFFAAKAMASLVLAMSTSRPFCDACCSEASNSVMPTEDYVAARAFDWADSMIKARAL